jgi:hypothetical protein
VKKPHYGTRFPAARGIASAVDDNLVPHRSAEQRISRKARTKRSRREVVPALHT